MSGPCSKFLSDWFELYPSLPPLLKIENLYMDPYCLSCINVYLNALMLIVVFNKSFDIIYVCLYFRKFDSIFVSS